MVPKPDPVLPKVAAKLFIRVLSREFQRTMLGMEHHHKKDAGSNTPTRRKIVWPIATKRRCVREKNLKGEESVSWGKQRGSTFARKALHNTSSEIATKEKTISAKLMKVIEYFILLRLLVKSSACLKIFCVPFHNFCYFLFHDSGHANRNREFQELIAYF